MAMNSNFEKEAFQYIADLARSALHNLDLTDKEKAGLCSILDLATQDEDEGKA